MTQQIINVGAAENDGTGESLRSAFQAVNDNFSNVWAAGPVDSQVAIRNNVISTNVSNQNLVISANGIGVITVNSSVVPGSDSVWDLGAANRQYDSVFARYYYGNASHMTGLPTQANLLAVATDILPIANVTYDIGSPSQSWNMIYANGIVAGNTSVLAIDVGNLHIPGGTNGYVLQTDGDGNLTWTAQTGGGGGNGTPGGANTQVQFNDAGEFGGAAGFTFNKTNGNLNVSGNIVTSNSVRSSNVYISSLSTVGEIAIAGSGGQIVGGPDLLWDFANARLWTTGVKSNGTITTTGIISATGNITTAGYFIGDGSQLTGITTAPAGSNTYVQFNDNGAFGADGGLTYDKSSGNLNVPGGFVNAAAVVTSGRIEVGTTLSAAGDITSSGNIVTDGDAGDIVLTGGNISGAANIQADVFVGTQANVDLIAGTYDWTFDTTGNLTLPGNTFAVNYANGTPVTVGGGNTFTSITMIDTPSGASNIIQYGMGNFVAYNDGGWVLGEYNGSQYGQDGIRINPGIEGAADIYLPGDPVANVNPLSINNYNGNVLLQAGGTSAGQQLWKFNNNGNLTVAGNIQSDNAGFAFTSTITGITTGNPTVVVTLADDVFGEPFTGQVTISGVSGTTEANGTWWYRATEVNQFELYTNKLISVPVDGTAWTAYASGGVAVATDLARLSVTAGFINLTTGNTNTWNFDSVGNLNLPGSATIQNQGGTITFYPDRNFPEYGLQTFISFDNDIHLQSGNIDKGIALGRSYGSGAHIRLVGNVASNPGDAVGDIVIRAQDYAGGNAQQWHFDTTGTLSAPGNIISAGNIAANAFVGEQANIDLIAGEYTWSFDTTGNIVTPGTAGDIIMSGGNIANVGSIYFTPNDTVSPVIVPTTSELSIYANSSNHAGDFVQVIGNGNATIASTQTVNLVAGGEITWAFDSTGNTVFPTLNTVRGDNPAGNITGSTLRIGNGSSEAIITTPDGDVSIPSSQRLVINPGKGFDGSSGEGGDIYLWAGRGGTGDIANAVTGGSGGDIKIRGGQGMSGGDGGYIRMEAGDTNGDNGAAGYIEITAGQTTGGNPGQVTITGGYNNAGDGGAVNITGGTGTNNTGNVNITTTNAGNIGGAINATAGYGVHEGGSIQLRAGESGENPGGVYLYGGVTTAFTTAQGGPVHIEGGFGSFGDGGGGPGGDVEIIGGASTDSQGGNVNITAGDRLGGGAPGNIYLNSKTYLSLVSTAPAPGVGESAWLSGTRTNVGGLDKVEAYAYELPGAGTPTLCYVASDTGVQSAKITFAVQSNGAAANWEQFDVAVINLGGDTVLNVSNRIRANASIDWTAVSANVNGGQINVWLTQPTGQTVGYVNYNAVEFNIMVD